MTVPAYEGLIFDLDGTLIDSAPDIAAAVSDCFAARGWPPVDADFVERFIGNGARRLLIDVMEARGLPADAATVDAAVAGYIGNYTRQPVRFTRFHSHVEEDLRALRAAGFRLGICTNKPHELTLRVLAMLGIAPLFEAVLGADAVPASKPDPGHLLALVELMRLEPGRWAYIGDTEVDQATARAAGGPFFVVPWGGGGRVAVGEDRRLGRLIDLMAYRPAPAGQES